VKVCAATIRPGNVRCSWSYPYETSELDLCWQNYPGKVYIWVCMLPCLPVAIELWKPHIIGRAPKAATANKKPYVKSDSAAGRQPATDPEQPL
jgi:hypothetical protein